MNMVLIQTAACAQVISKLATGAWQAVVEAYALGRSLALHAQGEFLLGLLDDMEELLATNRRAALLTFPSCCARQPQNALCVFT